MRITTNKTKGNDCTVWENMLTVKTGISGLTTEMFKFTLSTLDTIQCEK